MLQALPDILHTLPDARILLVGGGVQENALKQLAMDLGIADKVIFTGRVPHGQVQRYYDLVDIFVYPRLSMRLTELVTPLKPLEAMAQGRLVIASGVGGHKELIKHGETGYLFDAGNAQALSNTVINMLKQRENWPAFHAAARRFVETERNWPISVARYQAVYAQVTAKKDSSHV